MYCEYCGDNESDESIINDPYGHELDAPICRGCYVDWWTDLANSVDLSGES